MSDPAGDLRSMLQRSLAEIPAHLAENDGWPQRAMPAMLAALELSEAPTVGWFVDALNPLYAKAVPPPEGWREYRTSGYLAGIALIDEQRLFLRANLDLPSAIVALGHELWHLREHAHGEPTDEDAATKFGHEAAARFWATQYR